MKRGNNYDIMADQARKRFLTYDQEQMIKKFGLSADAEYISLSFAGSPCRIRRKDGKLFCLDGAVPREGDFNEALSVYDMLCCPAEHPVLADRWESLSSLGGIIAPGTATALCWTAIPAYFPEKQSAWQRPAPC